MSGCAYLSRSWRRFFLFLFFSLFFAATAEKRAAGWQLAGKSWEEGVGGRGGGGGRGGETDKQASVSMATPCSPTATNFPTLAELSEAGVAVWLMEASDCGLLFFFSLFFFLLKRSCRHSTPWFLLVHDRTHTPYRFPCHFLALKEALPRIPRSSLLPPAGCTKKAPPTLTMLRSPPRDFFIHVTFCLYAGVWPAVLFLSVIFIFPDHQFDCTDKIRASSLVICFTSVNEACHLHSFPELSPQAKYIFNRRHLKGFYPNRVGDERPPSSRFFWQLFLCDVTLSQATSYFFLYEQSSDELLTLSPSPISFMYFKYIPSPCCWVLVSFSLFAAFQCVAANITGTTVGLQWDRLMIKQCEVNPTPTLSQCVNTHPAERAFSPGPRWVTPRCSCNWKWDRGSVCGSFLPQRQERWRNVILCR